MIGVGGGFDILNAIYFDATDITGIEINGATADILTHTYRDYFRKWVEDPRVHLVHAEGRNFLARTREKYDVIQLSGVDSYSGTPGAANVFSENYLYTSEAFDLYLSRLSDNGILNMMRLEVMPPQQMFRALTTAVSALRRAGIEQPADHIMMLTEADGAFTALLVKKAPFTPAEQQRLEAWTSGTRFFKLSAGPRINSQRGNAYQIFLSLRDPRDERDFIMNYPFDISPAEDTRPFFFKNSFWWHVFPSSPMIWGHTPVMEYSILLLLIIISFAALLCIYIPLRYLAKLGMHARGTQRYGLFFAGTGIGYLAIEIALLQKFGLFLGHPNYALSVVLASLLLTSGLGSLFSGTIIKALREVRFVSYTLAALILLEYGLVFPRLLAMIVLPFWVRTLIVCVLVAPIGLCLGTFVPSALEGLKSTAPAFVPWAWGINGIFSVLAPVLSVGFSMTWGINALLLAAIPIYLLVGWVLPKLSETPAVVHDLTMSTVES